MRRKLRKHELELTDRELEIISLVAQGLMDKEIARKLGISYQTVKNHIYNARRVFFGFTRPQLALWYTGKFGYPGEIPRRKANRNEP